MDFYEILGVSPDADETEIKRAYRSKAQKLHPDKNPGRDTTEEMRALQFAYESLTDPYRRACYDRGINPIPEEEFENSAQDIVVQVFFAVIDRADHRPIFDLVAAEIRKSMAQGDAAIKLANRSIRKFEKIRKRMIHKKKRNDFLLMQFNRKHAALHEEVRQHQTRMAVHERALELLDDYEDSGEFTAEPKRYVPLALGGIMGPGSTTF